MPVARTTCSKPASASSGAVAGPAEFERHAGPVQAAIEVAQRFAELFLAGDAARQVELAADFRGSVEQGDPMATFGRGQRAGHARRAGADNGDPLGACGLSISSSVSRQARGLTRQ
jgi:hypothetical protein